MKKEITKKQILKGIGLWIILIVLSIVAFKVLVHISNPYNVPEQQLEQIKNEEGLK